MTACADLVIGLHRHNDAKSYRVEPQLRLPGSGAPIEPSSHEVCLTQFNLTRLRSLTSDEVAYGQFLTGCLFAPEAVRTLFAQARAATQAQTPPVPLRLRLYVGPTASALHELRWELLHDPQKPGVLLTTDEKVLFSRYLTSPDWRPVRTRPQAGVNALVVIANPDDVGQYRGEDGRQLAPLDVVSEWQRAKQGLGRIPVTGLCSGPGVDCHGRPTLDELIAHLRDGYDILYLVCHGALRDGQPLVWLENEEGQAKVVPGDDVRLRDGLWCRGLVSQLSQLPRLPRLVVLASCQGAGEGDEWASRDTRALSALGPRLVEAGVPAVVAMQGSVTMGTVAQFIPVFFEELRRDGQIDRAMAAARRVVHGRMDWWMPVLFSRLDNGLLFSPRGRMVGDQPEAFWTRLLKNISHGRCTPILGPDVTADLLPGPAALAQALAKEYEYPLADCDCLARVAQFIATQGPADLCEDVVQALTVGFKRRMGLVLEPGGPEHGLSKAIEASHWSDQVQELFENEIHHQLADLNLPLYLTTNFDSFMTLALRSKRPSEERGRVRRVVVDWRKEVSQEPGRADFDLKPKPSVQDPVVLHLFGTAEDPRSMVLTEDDYLDYLARIYKDHQGLLPSSVQTALASTSLLFLGYHLHDLALKVILRGLLPTLHLERWGRKHVAVQIEPSAVNQTHQQNVIGYLRTYFSDAADVKIDVYRGSAHQFVAELHKRWQQEYGHG